jgi:hypothetical protein
MGELVEGFFFPSFLGLMGHLLQVGALRWSHQTVGLSGIWSTGQVVTGTCNSSLPACARWSDLLLFLPSGN